MSRWLKSDVLVALVLIAVTIAFFVTTFNVRRPPFTVVGAEVWPRVILVPMFLLSVALLVKALREAAVETPTPGRSFGEWLAYYRNPLIVFALFFGFLLALRPLGMLVAGAGFTFFAQLALGYRSPRHVLLYAVVAVAAVGGMWAVFQFGLGVQLPRGRLTGI